MQEKETRVDACRWVPQVRLLSSLEIGVRSSLEWCRLDGRFGCPSLAPETELVGVVGAEVSVAPDVELMRQNGRISRAGTLNAAPSRRQEVDGNGGKRRRVRWRSVRSRAAAVNVSDPPSNVRLLLFWRSQARALSLRFIISNSAN